MAQQHLIKRDQQPQQQTFGCQVYKSPSANQVVEAFTSVTLEWDGHCFDSEKNMDMYLQSIDSAAPIHVWKNVVGSSNKLTTQFQPEWWNSTETVSLQLVLTPADLPLWAGLGPGPIFVAHFNGSVPAGASASAHQGKQLGGPSVEYMTDLFHRSHHALSGGKLGAAIFMPLLAVGLAIFAYIFISRRRSGEASKRWSEYVDKRMSVMGGSQQHLPPIWDSAQDGPLPSIRGIPGSRVASMYRHSASLPPRASMMASTHTRLSTFSLAPPTLPRPLSHHSRTASAGTPRASALERNSVVSFAPAPSELHGNMGRSGLRFQVGTPSGTDPNGSLVSLKPPLSTHEHAGNGSATEASSVRSRSATTTTSSGMRRLDGPAAALTPDEALRQYTLHRGHPDA
ncbi:hypothetical protein PCASD_06718 [Puccinia coronata f. sp. avenae]|uniref:Uncharacterized protein n=1 Tax=Puccinia coronata f. sp. avenae TaxID=200324 RepID=A0A2N5TFH2_9BASI|nr:hypothetical protein PCASD_06718 [Puccinia coronata f. sp. avenae]